MKIPEPHDHAAIFWTRGEDGADTNRFNIFWNASFTGAPDSDRFIDGDYRDPTSAAHNIGGPGYNGGDPLSIGEWHHVAIVRTELGGGSFQWDWYIDGVLSPGHTTTTSDPMPTSLSWLIAGRAGSHSLNMLIDEVRLTDRALAPGEFLNAIPEPATISLAALGAICLMVCRRRRAK
jgi:hypothetical protein